MSREIFVLIPRKFDLIMWRDDVICGPPCCLDEVVVHDGEDVVPDGLQPVQVPLTPEPEEPVGAAVSDPLAVGERGWNENVIGEERLEDLYQEQPESLTMMTSFSWPWKLHDVQWKSLIVRVVNLVLVALSVVLRVVSTSPEGQTDWPTDWNMLHSDARLHSVCRPPLTLTLSRDQSSV